MTRPQDLVGNGPVLVLAPHADDETLGCGGLLSDCWAARIPAHVVCLTDGAASHPNSSRNIAAIRARELAAAITELGGDPTRDLTCLGYPDAALHDVPTDEITSGLTLLVDRLRVRVLIAPSPLDQHCDHETTARIADLVIAQRPFLRLMHYPVWSRWSGEGTAPPVPASRRHGYPVDPDLKARAIAAHASQMGLLIDDDRRGFTMPAGFAAMFANGPEIYDERVE